METTTSSDAVSSSFVLQRKRIEFEPAKKHFRGFNSNGFRIETLNPDSTRKIPTDTRHSPVQRVDFTETGLDPDIFMGITFRRIGAGLQNLGNTCFLNSVLQCLTYTEPLAAYLQSGKHQNSCHVTGFCALCAIQKHVSRALESTGRSLVPKDLVANLRCISRNFRNSRQEDAHEYMVNLLESMHKCCLPTGVPSESPAAYEKSLVHKIFGGRLRSQVECQQCGYCSNKFDPFIDLSLEIYKADTLPTALRNFTAKEMLDGGERHYQCQQCKQKVRAKKQLTVHKAPYVLTIHLKRFHALDPTRKVDKKVIYERSLDMKPFVSDPHDKDLKYSLYGVLVHYGHSTHSGHYVCFVRTSSGMWYLLNDNVVRQVAEKTVLDQKAYMLFYVRDRKNTILRNPVDIVCKDNMGTVGNTNIADLVLIQISKKQEVNDSLGNKSYVADTSGNQKDVSKSGTSVVLAQKKDASLPQSNGLVMQGFQVPKAESTLCNPFPKDSSKGVHVLNSDQGGHSQPPVESIISKDEAPKIENGTFTSAFKPDASIKVSNSGCGPQGDAASEPVSEGTSLKINFILNEGSSSKILSGDSDKLMQNIPMQLPSLNEKASSLIDHQRKENEPSCSSTQGGVVIPTDVFENSPSAQANVNGKEYMNEQSKLSLPDTSREQILMNNMNLIAHGKIKKLTKGQVPRMHLGLKLSTASVRSWKKKHRESRRRSMHDWDHIKNRLSGDLELGPSTSMNGTPISLGSNSQSKISKSSSKKRRAKRKCQRDSPMDLVDGENRGGDIQNVAERSTNKHLHEGSTVSEVNWQNAGNCSRAEISKRDASDAFAVKVLQGVEETTVARWDGMEMPTTSSAFGSFGPEKLSIGHVADEWDEEYDRGKRKKVRLFKHTFGGPNPFQEIVTKKLKSNKSQSKKLKKDRSSSGNQPFRI